MPRVRSGGGSAKDRRRDRRAGQSVPKDVQAARLRMKIVSQKQKIRAANKVIDWSQITGTERAAMGKAMLSVERNRRQATRPTEAQIARAKRAKDAAQKALANLQQQIAALNL